MSGEPAVSLPAEDRLATLFDAHEARLYRLARRLTPSAEDARDLVQDTFVRTAQSLTTVPIGFAEEEAWLVRVLINIRRDQWRKRAVRKRAASTLRVEVTHSLNAESSLITKRAVWAALDVLQPRRRAIVIMHELEGISSAAIAALLGVKKVTVQWHLSRARSELKRLLASYLGGTS